MLTGVLRLRRLSKASTSLASAATSAVTVWITVVPTYPCSVSSSMTAWMTAARVRAVRPPGLAVPGSCPEWNPCIRSASGQLAAGARLTLRLVPAGGRAMTFRPTVLAAQPDELLRWIGRLIVPGIFDGTHQFALEDLGGRTRLTQSETFRGLLVPLTGKTLARTEAGFRASTGR